MTAYPATGNGDIAPLAPAPSGLSEPQFVALDKNGNIYVTNSCTAAITIYAKGSNGDTPPIATIGGSKTGLSYPAGIALDSSGKIYVADDGLEGDGPGSVFVYPALGSSTGLLDEAPTATIAGSNTGLSGPFGIALDSSGKIYVADFYGASVYIFPALGSSTGLLNQAPIATIGGSNTGLQRPAGIALDSKGDIYVVDDGPSSVGPDSVFAYPAPGSSTGLLDEAPSAAVTAAVTTGLKFPEGIALDSSGNIYVADYGAASVFVYPALGSSTGLLNETPTATISGSNTGLTAPFGIALYSSGNIYVTDEFAAIVFVFRRWAAAPGCSTSPPPPTSAGATRD